MQQSPRKLIITKQQQQQQQQKKKKKRPHVQVEELLLSAVAVKPPAEKFLRLNNNNNQNITNDNNKKQLVMDVTSKLVNGAGDFYNLISCHPQPQAQQVFLNSTHHNATSSAGPIYANPLPVYQSPSPQQQQDIGVGFSMNFINKKMDTSNHFHIFVGDLAPEIESKVLLDAFSNFGFVTECKIIKDMHTQKPKGYGFVAYASKEEAELAIQMMNGQVIGSRTIRTGWAVRKTNAIQPKDQKPLNYSEVINASSESNCTVYVGGITTGLTEEVLRDAFKEFGEILEVRVFKDKGYSFLRFDTHEGAARAIITMHGQNVSGQPCKCSWGKESSDVTSGSIQSYITSLSKQAMMLGQFGLLASSTHHQNFKASPATTGVSGSGPGACPSILAAAAAVAAANSTVPSSAGIQMNGHHPHHHGPHQQIPTSLCLRSIPPHHINQNAQFITSSPSKTSAGNMILSTPQNPPLLFSNQQQLCNFFTAPHPGHSQATHGHNPSSGPVGQMIPADLIQHTLNDANALNFYPSNDLIPIGSTTFIPSRLSF